MLANALLIEINKLSTSLLESIYSRNSSTLTILRQARHIGNLADNTRFVRWVDKEINGYSIKDKLPNYRIIQAKKTVSFTHPLPYSYTKFKQPLLKTDEFVDYPIYDGISKIEQFISNKGTSYKGEVIETYQGTQIYELFSLAQLNVQKLADEIQEKVVEEIQGLIKKSLKEQLPIHNTASSVIEILKRFNDYRKYDKDRINNEIELNGEVYKILKPMYPDLIDEEYLKRIGEKNPKVDFAIPSERALLEDKYVRTKAEIPKIQDQLFADIPQYLQKNKDQWNGLIIFIYSKVNISSDLIDELKRQEGIIDVIVCYDLSPK